MTPDPIVEIPAEFASQLLRARGRMPFGGIVYAPEFVGLNHGEPSGLLNLHRLGAYLEELADVLGRVAEENTEKADRLLNLESDVAAVRRLLGTEVGS